MGPQISSLCTYMCHLDTKYLVGAHKYLVYAHIAPTRYQVSSWGTYVHKLDTKYLVGAHMGPNSIPMLLNPFIGDLGDFDKIIQLPLGKNLEL